jgi:hypothetical protein
VFMYAFMITWRVVASQSSTMDDATTTEKLVLTRNFTGLGDSNPTECAQYCSVRSGYIGNRLFRRHG